MYISNEWNNIAERVKVSNNRFVEKAMLQGTAALPQYQLKWLHIIIWNGFLLKIFHRQTKCMMEQQTKWTEINQKVIKQQNKWNDEWHDTYKGYMALNRTNLKKGLN